MKMLTGLLPASEGEALLFGRPLDARRSEDALSGRLHVAVLLALCGTDGSAEPRSSRASVSPAEAEGEGADRRTGRTLRPCRLSRPSRSGSAARHPPAALARGRHRARARDADPRRADFGGRSRGARPVLGVADRSVAQPGRDDLRLDPFHERSRTLRPDLADGFGARAGDGNAGGACQSSRRRHARRRVHQLSRRGIGSKRQRDEAGGTFVGQRRRQCRSGSQRPFHGSVRSVCLPIQYAKRWSCCATRSGSASPCSALPS